MKHVQVQTIENTARVNNEVIEIIEFVALTAWELAANLWWIAILVLILHRIFFRRRNR